MTMVGIMPTKRHLIEDVVVHGEDAGIDRAVDALGLVVLARRAEREEKRQKMLVGRVCARAVRSARTVVGERLQVVLVQALAYPFRKFLCLGLRFAPAAHP